MTSAEGVGGAGGDGDGGDGGAPGAGGLGECESEVVAVAGGCLTEYSCDGGAVHVECGSDSETGAECDCFLDDELVDTCITSDDGAPADGEQCYFPDNCCYGALGGDVPGEVGSIEIEADPLDLETPGSNAPNTFVIATFGPPPEQPCIVEYEDNRCTTTQCDPVTTTGPASGQSAGMLSFSGPGAELVPPELERGFYLGGLAESLWDVGGSFTVGATGDVVSPFAMTVETLGLVGVPGWSAEQTIPRDADIVQAVEDPLYQVALHLYAHDTGDFPVWRVDCVFGQWPDEVIVPAAALATIDAVGGVLWISSRVQASLVAGDHRVTVGAETISAWANVVLD